MYIRKKELIFYIVVIVVVIIAAHFIMITSRTKVIEREKQAAVNQALRDYQVNNPVVEVTASESTDDFFVNYRIERSKVRSKHIDILKDLLNNEDTVVKQKAQSDLQKLLNLGELENQVENLLKVRGLSDAVIFLSGNQVSVIVLANEFDQTKASQILDTVARMFKVNYTNINIIQK